MTGSISNIIVVDIDGPEGLDIYKEKSGSTMYDTVAVETPSGGYIYII